MERILTEISVDDLFKNRRYNASLIVTRQSEFQRLEGAIDPGNVGPTVCRQSLWLATRAGHYSKEGLILTPPAQPRDLPPRFRNLDISGFCRWDWSLTIDVHYLCPKRDILAAFEERWGFDSDFQFSSYVAVLSDWSLMERFKPSSS